MKCFETLKERGYIYQVTHEDEVRKILNGDPITFYLGIDPTADGLHIGHFFALSMARWLQDFGHKAIILIGGATALVGDPTGKTDIRTMLTKEDVEYNKNEVKKLVKRFVTEDTLIVDNYDWFKDINYIDFMLNIGIHFNVNKMLATDCYKNRLESGGLTFLEMGYMLMQGYDAVYLREQQGCVLQIGGSDQWANIVAGVDLGRKLAFHEGRDTGDIYGLTCPLLVKADGEKMGKTAKGTLWVSRDKTDSYDFYQAFVNTFDEDVERLLSFFTKIPISEIKAMCKNDIISAKKKMAFEVTKLVHGEEEALKVEKASLETFASGESANMPTAAIEVTHDINILDVMTLSGLVATKSEARRLIEQGGVKLNSKKVDDLNLMIKINELEEGIILQKGKKTYLKVVKN